MTYLSEMADRQQQYGAVHADGAAATSAKPDERRGQHILLEASCMKEESVEHWSWRHFWVIVESGLCICAPLLWSLYVRQARRITDTWRVYLTDTSLVHTITAYNICGMQVSTTDQRMKLADIQTIRHARLSRECHHRYQT